MIRLLRYWLPVVPVAMAALVLLRAAPDLGACPARGELLILCEPIRAPAVVIGPVDLILGAPVASALDPWSAGLFVALAVVVAIVGVHRLRGSVR